jgi:peptide-methionine (S)-S-oxide reductase
LDKQRIFMETNPNFETAIFAGGCFWCTEAVFLALEGVQKVQSGYIGGHTPNPNYKEICTGTTGHAEAIAIIFDPAIITFITLVELFFATHDPTTLNRQGNDVGTQYRSEIFYQNQEQKEISLQYISFLDDQNVFGNRIVTQVSQASQFFPAEEYHSNYYNRNKEQSYCSYVITPKMDKLKKIYADKLKK